MKEHGIDLQALKESMGLTSLDDFDFIIHIAFDKKPLTRRERANDVKKRDFISKYNGMAREVIEALLEMYSDEGISQLEDTQVLRLDPFIRMGKPAAIVKLFGGKQVLITLSNVRFLAIFCSFIIALNSRFVVTIIGFPDAERLSIIS